MRSVIQSAFAAWWRELIPLALINIAWLLLQFPIVTAAPATAALYVVAGNVLRGDPASWPEFWQALREHFGRAIRWGLLQGAVYFVGVFNLTYYSAESGLLWDALRAAWIGGLIAWTALQLLYWPLLLAADDRRITNTLRNALVMLGLNPLFVAGLVLLTGAIVALSAITAAPVGLVMAVLVVLLGTAAVQDRLSAARQAEKNIHG